MKYQRTTLALALATSTAMSFSMVSRAGTTSSFLGKSMVSRFSPSVTAKAIGGSRPGMTMLLGKLFGGGSAFGRKIDYTALDFPGNELGEAATAGNVLVTSTKKPNLAVATFAGGCFWGLELAYQRVPGVEYTAVGYAQGPEEFPNYDQVCMGATGHTEAVIVYYDPKECKYEDLLDTFFERVDPTTVDGQGRDFGKQYRTGVYFHTPEQEALAKARFAEEQKKFKRPFASELQAAKPFWPAEKYHQQYLEKGGRFNAPQDASKGAKDTIRCYG